MLTCVRIFVSNAKGFASRVSSQTGISVYKCIYAVSCTINFKNLDARHKLFFNEMESLSISSVEIENCLQDRKENRCEMMFFIFFFLSFFLFTSRALRLRVKYTAESR